MADENDKKDIIQEVPVVADRSVMPAVPHHTNDVTKEPGKFKLRFLSAAALIIVSLSAGFAGGWLGARDNSDNATIEKQQVVLKSQGELISSIAGEVSPSVVSVEVTGQSRAINSFFGFDGAQQQQSAGTGFIIDKSGIIVTNRHVVPSGSTKIDVTLSDGTKFENVELIGRTAESDPLDVAFLKITDTKGKELKAAKLGDSSAVKVGESVVAIGNALGQFQNTVTSGIISGHGRNVTAGDETGANSENLQNLFQTDTAINQGNSGGPLANLDGQVIGINTAVAAGDAQNIGFAIPINDVKGVIENVIKKGKLERPFIGVVFVPVTADLAKQYNLSVDQGAYIPPAVSVGQETVIADSPAGKAGIKEQDIIVKVNDDVIDESHSLTSLLGKYSVGDKVKLDIVRDGKHQIIEVTLAAAPENQ